jgi:hypothetical protein
MIVWGGFGIAGATDTGGSYDPLRDADSWTLTSLEGAPAPRGEHTAVWTGRKMIVWGGWESDRITGAYCAAGGCDGILCDDGNACTQDACNPASSLCAYSPVPGPCDDGDPCTENDQCAGAACAGDPAGEPPDEVGSSVRLTGSLPETWIQWNSAQGAATHDVLRGTVSGLPVGSGAESCIAFGTSSAFAVDSDSPPPGAAYWYLVRGRNACGNGGYGSAAVNGSPTTVRASSACP